ncbi:uncharacterized protein A1O9_13125 [Exophiala aquamarina CBS 119918]|uniref:Uncharacterized protein n=1 Tax=Exophiala aquamarina CBS 119918 TaxID=1182545 RepID=A0A072NT99_9EURO|nr:uncharacterized protein A1O9_13125 [Exophiala aquamarina CBS 119918]KEF50826.1 hypothetical protein A1O9_13125 [Exophiala aquamarina CBS 119918]
MKTCAAWAGVLLLVVILWMLDRGRQVVPTVPPVNNATGTLALATVNHQATVPACLAPLHLPGPFFYPGRAFDTPTGVEDPDRAACRPATPLFIPFASNACLLVQTVVSFISEGWPPSQIIVVENTGRSDENARGTIPPEDHAFMNYTLLCQTLGVHVYRSPVRNTFAQVQNLVFELAKTNGWPSYYQSHQDVVVRSRDDVRSFYDHVLEEDEDRRRNADSERWALVLYRYDWLSHVRVAATAEVGPWDVLIPWYPSDCDYYARVRAKGFQILDFDAGVIHDVASCLSDLSLLFRPKNSSGGQVVDTALRIMADTKRNDKAGRNTWQGRQADGTLSSDFGPRYDALVKASRKSYYMKWGTNRCDPTAPRSFFPWWKGHALGSFLQRSALE